MFYFGFQDLSFNLKTYTDDINEYPNLIDN